MANDKARPDGQRGHTTETNVMVVRMTTGNRAIMRKKGIGRFRHISFLNHWSSRSGGERIYFGLHRQQVTAYDHCYGICLAGLEVMVWFEREQAQ